jgi:hypothetical protein
MVFEYQFTIVCGDPDKFDGTFYTSLYVKAEWLHHNSFPSFRRFILINGYWFDPPISKSAQAQSSRLRVL